MADKKISQLTGATTPLAGTEEVPLVQSSSTKKVSVANLTAGRTVSATGFSTENTSTNLSITGATVQAGGVNTNVSIVLATKGSGGVEIPAGAAATPAIRFAADTDTGIYADTANTLVVANGGVETLRTTTNNTLQIGSSTGATPKVFVYANNSVAGADVNAAVYIRQDGTNHIQTWAGSGGNVRGYWESAGDLVIDDTNIRFATAAKGINFTANTNAPGMTSELLNWYEEGTWATTISDTANFTGTPTLSSGKYTRVGRLVTIEGKFAGTVTIANLTSYFKFTLPFSRSATSDGGAGVVFTSSSFQTGGIYNVLADTTTAYVVYAPPALLPSGANTFFFSYSYYA
jgi:hypothetical protein